MEAEIVLKYENEREAEAVARAVSPDNLKVPPGLLVQTSHEDDLVISKIKCETKLGTFIATTDDLLRCVSVAEKAFSAAKSLESSSA